MLDDEDGLAFGRGLCWALPVSLLLWVGFMVGLWVGLE
jgi:hypothetical protein